MTPAQKARLKEHPELLALLAQQPPSRVAVKITQAVCDLLGWRAAHEALASGGPEWLLVEYDDGSCLSVDSLAGGGHPDADKWDPCPAELRMVHVGADGAEAYVRYSAVDKGRYSELPPAAEEG